MAGPYSDLQVVPHQQPDYSGLQQLDYAGLQQPDYSGLQLPEYSGLYHYNTKPADPPTIEDKSLPQTPAPKRILCGVSARTFWILLAVIITTIVIAAAVGGGVGRSLASRNSKNADSSASSLPLSSPAQSTTSTTPSSTTTSLSTGPITSSPTNTPAITVTQLPGPTTTLLRDCPSSNNTLYSINIGSVMTFRKVCNLSYQNTLNGSAMVNEPTTSLDDCINLCAAYNAQNKNEIATGQESVCNAVCWRNTFVDDEFPGQCFGYTTQNSTNAFIVNKEAICDSAAWINQKL